MAADSKYYDLREQAPPMVFFSLWQRPVSAFEIVVKTRVAASGVTAAIRRALRQVSSRLPILDTITLDRQLEGSLTQETTLTMLCTIFGVLAVLLASVGIHGTLAYSVAGRTKEIGVRMAIGAQRFNVLWLVVRDSLLLIGIGLVLGFPCALGGARLLKSFLFGVPMLDPLAIGAAALSILTLSTLAGYLPARRASRIDPLIALRHE